ncbi:unnamed protein product [Symbiodinium necroappetens]|uniref:Uncharacterized protein n=1 Tax=Symbiodinium necroappetens TaxID=1628268 RepID=A0A812VSD7_9DINO|nr:unnamed protein product [Symbiodinium necroappetens]
MRSMEWFCNIVLRFFCWQSRRCSMEEIQGRPSRSISASLATWGRTQSELPANEVLERTAAHLDDATAGTLWADFAWLGTLLRQQPERNDRAWILTTGNQFCPGKPLLQQKLWPSVVSRLQQRLPEGLVQEVADTIFDMASALWYQDYLMVLLPWLTSTEQLQFQQWFQEYERNQFLALPRSAGETAPLPGEDLKEAAAVGGGHESPDRGTVDSPEQCQGLPGERGAAGGQEPGSEQPSTGTHGSGQGEAPGRTTAGGGGDKVATRSLEGRSAALPHHADPRRGVQGQGKPSSEDRERSNARTGGDSSSAERATAAIAATNDRRDQDRENAALQDLVVAMGRLTLRIEDSLNVYGLDTSFMLFLQTKEPEKGWTITKELYSVAKEWNRQKAEEASALTQPMRTEMCLKAKEMGLTDGTSYLYLKWNQKDHHYEPDTQEPLALAKAMEIVDYLVTFTSRGTPDVLPHEVFVPQWLPPPGGGHGPSYTSRPKLSMLF